MIPRVPSYKSWLLSAFVFFIAVSLHSNALARAEQAAVNCTTVGGTFMEDTRVIDKDTTLGIATGDLKGAVSSRILEIIPGPGGILIVRLKHYWVTESGDVIISDPVEAISVPAAVPGLFGVTFQNKIIGGTGKFEGATGLLTVWGGADLVKGLSGFRYSGEVCFSTPTKP